jgi:hypothetical protein
MPALLRGDLRKYAGIIRPFEAADFQALIQKQETITFPYKYFETILLSLSCPTFPSISGFPASAVV